MQEAEESMNRMIDLVDQIVASNPDLQNRINAHAMHFASPVLPSQPPYKSVENNRLRSLSSSPYETDLQE